MIGSQDSGSTMRRRNLAGYDGGDISSGYNNNGYDTHLHSAQTSYSEKRKDPMKRQIIRRLDMFPKVDQDLTVKTERGGLVSLISYAIMFFLVLAEILNHMSMSRDTIENLVVDTSLSPKMQVNMNITFPSISCVDLHVDVMDVAGDSQLDIDDGLVKKRLLLNGKPVSDEVIKAELNKHEKEDRDLQAAIKAEVGEDYCGSCYGAHENEGDCCNTCDSVLEAYKKKHWHSEVVQHSAEQCKREGKSSQTPKRISTGEGCNLSGYMNINRVAGNFHIALGEGVERDGRHIHLFMPDDTPNFNTSHIIHELTFGPKVSKLEHGGLESVHKITTNENGGTGLFQYFIKVVPTTYKDKNGKVIGSTNRYFFTERYRPLMLELIEDEHFELAGDRDKKTVGAQAGGHMKDSHSKNDHHNHMNSILPGIFFVYEISPFAVEVTAKSVPISHLLIRIMALLGGIVTTVSWVDGFMFRREKNNRFSPY